MSQMNFILMKAENMYMYLTKNLNSFILLLSLQRFEQQYIEQVKRGTASEKAQFEYAWCLIRSKQEIDMKKGVSLLEGKYFFFIFT